MELAPKKRGPQPGTRYRLEHDHVCPECGVSFQATAKRVYHSDACRQRAGRRRRHAAATHS